MDGYEATRIVFSRIQSLDPENASKIMGLLLIQDHGEKEMIRLAFGPEALVHSVILKARKELGLNSPTNSSSSPSSPSPLFSSNPVCISRQNSSSSSSRLGFNISPSLTIPNPSSNNSSSWSAISDLPSAEDLVSPSGSSLNPASVPFYANGGGGGGGAGAGGGGADLIDEFQLQDQLSFLNENSPNLGPKSPDLFYPHLDSMSSPTGSAADSMLFPSYWGGSLHRRSCSVSDVLGSEDPSAGFGWRPCLYFARGFCKNGSNCRFVHGGLGESDAASMVGSPSKFEMMDQCHEILRSKSAQQQRLAAASQLMGSASFPYSPKCMNLLLQQQQNDSQRAAVALMMGDDLHKFGRSRLDRNDLVNPASRQIYLTFPADSTFREEDVSNYFSLYGPVQDVRIPYQQKRMFGFVTFVYPETVKMILAKGNPHFVCDARVLVKPYKEKGKVPDKYRKQQQQVERGEFSPSPCGTPTGLDARDPFDLPFGTRMFSNNQDMLWRRKMEEHADLQQALELQSRRLMGMQLLDSPKQHHQRALSTGSPIPSPTRSPNLFNHSATFPPFHKSLDVPQENCSSPVPAISGTAPEKRTPNAASGKDSTGNEENGSGKESSQGEDNDWQESLEHNLPDSPFASPTKGSGEYKSAFNNGGGSEGGKDAASPTIPASSSANNNMVTSALDMASFKSFNCQMPRFSSGHGGIGMYAGKGGPTCPVGI